MKTILLDSANWDMTIDASGNMAVASDPYSQAQDAASGIKLFAGELYYNTTLGVPYFASILGKFPPLEYIRSTYVLAALAVPGVTAAVCYFSSFKARRLKGQVQITDSAGNTAAAGF